VRVNPNEVVDIAVRFEVFAGRYMYHCHILEHEDHDMMRPFVVMPEELMPFMERHAMDGEVMQGMQAEHTDM
jgi:spore coat protein A